MQGAAPVPWSRRIDLLYENTRYFSLFCSYGFASVRSEGPRKEIWELKRLEDDERWSETTMLLLVQSAQLTKVQSPLFNRILSNLFLPFSFPFLWLWPSCILRPPSWRGASRQIYFLYPSLLGNELNTPVLCQIWWLKRAPICGLSLDHSRSKNEKKKKKKNVDIYLSMLKMSLLTFHYENLQIYTKVKRIVPPTYLSHILGTHVPVHRFQ